VEKPDVEFPDVENPTLLSINNTKYLSLLSNKDNVPFAEIIEYLNQKAGTSYRATSKKTKQLITARWNEGFRLDDFMRVIDNKT
ncbi:conserved phage C-terminal domain-containing protein, partial [Brevibacillus brevis]